MRSLRSRNVDIKSSSSEVECNTSLDNLIQNKIRRKKRSIINEDSDNDITEETIKVLNNTEEAISKKLKKNKIKKSKRSTTQDSDLENPEMTANVLNDTEQSVNLSKKRSVKRKKVKRSFDESEKTMETLNVSDRTNVSKNENITMKKLKNQNSEKTLKVLNISNETNNANKNKTLRKEKSKKSQINYDANIEKTDRSIYKLNKSATKKKVKKICTNYNSENENLERTMNIFNVSEKTTNVFKNESVSMKTVNKSLKDNGSENKNPENTTEILKVSERINNISKHEYLTTEKINTSFTSYALNKDNSEKTIEILEDSNKSYNENQNITKNKKKKSRKSLISNENDQYTHTFIKVLNDSVGMNKKEFKKSKLCSNIDLITSERLSNTQTFFGLSKKDETNVTVNLDDEVFPAGSSFFKLEKSSSATSLNRTMTNSIECIEIEDSNIEDSDDKIKDVTSSKMENANEMFSTKTMNETFNKDTIQVVNRSGQWAVLDISNTKSETKITGTDYISENKITVHPKTIIPKINVLNETFDSPGKSNRKRWVKYLQTGTLESPLLKNTTYSELKSSRPLLSSSPLESTSTAKVLNSTFSTPLKMNRSFLKSTGKKNNSTIILDPVVSIKKSTTKSKPMPNFSLIHQKAFEKMESIQDYSERKKERAKQMMSIEKPKTNDESTRRSNKKQIVKSSQDLFGGVQTLNRFGIRVSKTPKDEKLQIKSLLKKPSNYKTPQRLKPSVKENFASKLQKPKPIERNILSLLQKCSDKSMIPHPKINQENPLFAHPKEKPVSVFSRGHYIAVANKTKVQDKLGNIENRRDTMKGVRTNRRFDLLMQMRNKK